MIKNSFILNNEKYVLRYKICRFENYIKIIERILFIIVYN